MKRTKKKPVILCVPTDPFKHDLTVCAGAEITDVTRALRPWAKESKHSRTFIRFINESSAVKNGFERVLRGTTEGYSLQSEADHFIVILKPVRHCWDYWETLMHELSHIVHWLAKTKGFEDEDETRAYLHEYLFHVVRRNLDGTSRKLRI